MLDISEFQTAYETLKEPLQRAQTDISTRIAFELAQIGNPYLVRGSVSGTRVKALKSVFIKCVRKRIRPDQILALSDLVGIRVVWSSRRANNVRRTANALR